MEKRNFKLQLTEDMIAEVQALGAEVDARVHLIDAMFENHKNDPDDSVFTSPAFVSYQRGLTEYKKKYENGPSESSRLKHRRRRIAGIRVTSVISVRKG